MTTGNPEVQPRGLRAAKEHLDLVLAASPAVVYGLEPRPPWTPTYVSPNAASITGYSVGELERPGFWPGRIHPDDRVRVLGSLERLGRDGPATLECRLLHADGTYRWLGGSHRLVRDPTGRPIEIAGHWIDVSDQHRATRAADEANRAKSEFLANMSHEIRTPMNGVIGLTELALETNLTDQQREYLQMVRNSAGALLETINSILDFSKIEAGKMELEAIDFTLWETVTGALKPLSLTARNKRVELLYDEAAGVPERLRGDPGRLRQALINLAGNAVKFTHAGSVRVMVSPVEVGDDVRLRFAVSDTGIGIPADKLGHIFESFHQVDGSMTRRFGGTGLGLAITAGIVGLMDGVIEVESREGEGSTFSFDARFQHPSRRRVPGSPKGSLEGLRTLAVDDHELNRRILVDFAARLGMDVIQAPSGRDALAALDDAYRSGRPVELAVLDCHMPEMDGFQLAERIRSDPRFAGLVLVAITAEGRPGDGARCQELGIVSYLLRPLAPAELRDALLLSMAGSRAEPGRRELVTRHSLREAKRSLQVLVAEDNPVNQQLAIHLLVRFGHHVRVARTGREVLEALDGDDFDVVLMDIQMPEMDGVETTREIRRREADAGDGGHLPIVAMTAHAMVGDRERFLSEGMDDYISKPISRDRLREVLRGIGGDGPSDGHDPHPRATPEATDSSAMPARPSSPHPPREPSFDRSALMERLESDLDLLRTLVSVFEADGPELLAEIEAALDSDDGPTLERAAHTLKGAVAVFAAERARGRAELLERLGRDGAMAEARGEYGPLRDAVLELVTDLRALVVEPGTPRPEG